MFLRAATDEPSLYRLSRVTSQVSSGRLVVVVGMAEVVSQGDICSHPMLQVSPSCCRIS